MTGTTEPSRSHRPVAGWVELLTPPAKRRSSGESGLGTGPVGLALLEERRHALLGVCSHGIERHDLLGQVVGLALVKIDLAVERLLADLQRQGARIGD